MKKDSKVEQLTLISCVLVNFDGTYGNLLKWAGAQMYQNLGFLCYQNVKPKESLLEMEE